MSNKTQPDLPNPDPRPEGELEEVMGVKHRDLPIEGVQFHPESILTRSGHALLQNFINQTHRN